jgi:hypothetical protein
MIARWGGGRQTAGRHRVWLRTVGQARPRRQSRSNTPEECWCQAGESSARRRSAGRDAPAPCDVAAARSHRRLRASFTLSWGDPLYRPPSRSGIVRKICSRLQPFVLQRTIFFPQIVQRHPWKAAVYRDSTRMVRSQPHWLVDSPVSLAHTVARVESACTPRDQRDRASAQGEPGAAEIAAALGPRAQGATPSPGAPAGEQSGRHGTWARAGNFTRSGHGQDGQSRKE